MQSTIKISFLSDWHISSGLGDGYLVDAVLNRDADGFPFIQGRTLKGVMRLGARQLGLCRDDLRHAETFFWDGQYYLQHNKGIGSLRISSAYFSDELKRQVVNHPTKKELIADLTLIRMHTSLTHEGVSKKGSLHSLECGIQGLDLFASLSVDPCEGISDDWITSYFNAVCAMVKHIGANRSRGLGRCQLSLVDHQKPVVLPQVNAFLMKFGVQQ